MQPSSIYEHFLQHLHSLKVTCTEQLKGSASIRLGHILGLLGGLTPLLVVYPARSAETIDFDYGPINRRLPVSSLETFVEEGTIDAELAPFASLIPEDKHPEFRRLLGEPLQDLNADLPEQLFSPFVLSQWLYSPIGERTLFYLGELLQTDARLNGQQALRAALILSAAEPEGVSILAVIKKFPTPSIRLDLDNILTLSREVKMSFDTTNRFVAAFADLSQAIASTEPSIDYSALDILSQTGPYAVDGQTVVLEDFSRDGIEGEAPRTFPVDLYWPEDLNAVPGPIPVMIISHGYSDTRTSFSEAAKSIASNGFLVVVPEHVGSNRAYRGAMEAGFTNETFQAMEFVNRPLDIRFVLDTLEQRNGADFQNRLQLTRVGIIGHSFGGYTALALAGATVEVDRVAKRCSPESQEVQVIDIAFLLQCRVLELSDSPDAMAQLTNGSLQDPRVQLVMALAPVSNLFGPSGLGRIETPVILFGGAYDIAAPVVPEQFDAFQWMTRFPDDKYFYLAENTSHTASLTSLTNRLFHPGTEIIESFDEGSEWFSDMLRTLIIAYGRTYLLGQDNYQPYLTSVYVETVSEQPLKLHLLRDLPDDFAP